MPAQQIAENIRATERARSGEYSRKGVNSTVGKVLRTFSNSPPSPSLPLPLTPSLSVRAAGPSPEPLEHSLDYYTSHVPTQISNSTFLPNSQPHTTAPLSSLRRKLVTTKMKFIVFSMSQYILLCICIHVLCFHGHLHSLYLAHTHTHTHTHTHLLSLSLDQK